MSTHRPRPNWFVVTRRSTYLPPIQVRGHRPPPLLRYLPPRFRDKGGEGEPVEVLVLFEVGEGDEEEAREGGGGAGGVDCVPDLFVEGVSLVLVRIRRWKDREGEEREKGGERKRGRMGR